ncbi:MAG: ATP-binding protein [Proteobacteria bacterium]|nr:ATP-binding protein [Pseudomonadota bacterium]
MTLITDERYTHCPLWQKLVQIWPHELLAISHNSLILNNILPDLEMIWVKAKQDDSLEALLAELSAFRERTRSCGLVVCLESAGPTEMDQLFAEGVDDIILLAPVLSEANLLYKTWLSWQETRKRQLHFSGQIERSEQALQSKTDFLGWLSHEIRTPMNGVLGMVELLQASTLDPDQKELVDVMERSGQRLLNLVNEVLDLSRLEAGKMNHNVRQFRLRQLLDDSLALFKAGANSRGIQLYNLVEADVPDAYCGDENKLGQILNNLLSNAVKFTQKGQVVLNVRVEAWEGEQCRLQIEIEDSGHGIAAEEQDKIFAPFEQTQSSHTYQGASSGLGLSLSKKLVELLGGTIKFRSVLGQGSTFTLSLPFIVDQSEPQNLSFSSLKPNVLTPIPMHIQDARILVVDDDPINLKVAERQLKRFSTEVTLAHSAVEALDLIEKKPFDLLFVDCQMPYMDGFELIQIMRARSQLASHTPVIALTALGRDEDKERVLQSGFSDYLAKPARFEAIQDILGRWLSSRSKS